MSTLPRAAIASAVLLAALLTMTLPARATQSEGWPREIDTAKGKIVIYQPQVDTFSGDKLTSRAAVSVTPTGKGEPVSCYCHGFSPRIGNCRVMSVINFELCANGLLRENLVP